MNLSKNYLKDDGVKVLSEALLGSYYPIVALNLSNNEITYKRVQHLFMAMSLGAGSGLIHLSLSNVEAL